jgi:predicted PurR-regulated permease PerM
LRNLCGENFVSSDATNRAAVDLTRAIALLTIIVFLTATFVLACEIILILFLGVLFGVFLTKLAGWISERASPGYQGSLAIVVITLLLTISGGTTCFFVQINQQVEDASGKIDQGMNELRSLIRKYPALKTTIATTPFVSQALSIKRGEEAKSAGGPRRESADREEKEGSSDQAARQLDSIPEPVRRAVGTVGQMFKTTFGLAVNSLLIFFVGLFLAITPNTYRDGVVRLVPTAKRPRVTQVLDSTGDALWRWLIGRFGSMLATGVGAFLLLLVLGVPMAGTLGILTGLLTFVPNIGAAVALFLSILFALPQGPGTVAAVVGGYIALQLVESYVVTPLIQQKAVSLPPALLISFQAIMGVLFGFIGTAVASPLLAAGKTVVEMLYVNDYLGDK